MYAQHLRGFIQEKKLNEHSLHLQKCTCILNARSADVGLYNQSCTMQALLLPKASLQSVIDPTVCSQLAAANSRALTLIPASCGGAGQPAHRSTVALFSGRLLLTMEPTVLRSAHWWRLISISKVSGQTIRVQTSDANHPSVLQFSDCSTEYSMISA